MLPGRDLKAGELMALIGASVALSASSCDAGSLVCMGSGMFLAILSVLLTFTGIKIACAALLSVRGGDEILPPRQQELSGLQAGAVRNPLRCRHQIDRAGGGPGVASKKATSASGT